MAVPMVEIILVSVGVRRRFFESLASDNMSADKNYQSMGKTNEKLLPSCIGAKLVDGKVLAPNIKIAELSAWVDSLNL